MKEGRMTSLKIPSASYQVTQKYMVAERVGEGTYGVVSKATSRADGRTVAIKQIRCEHDDEGVPSTALREIALLKELEHTNVVQLLDVLCSPGEMYLVFEFLDYDLKKYMKHQAKKKEKDAKQEKEKYSSKEKENAGAENAISLPDRARDAERGGGRELKDRGVLRDRLKDRERGRDRERDRERDTTILPPLSPPATNPNALSIAEAQLFTWQLLNGVAYCHAHRVVHRDLKPQNLLLSKNLVLKIADFGLARAFSIPIKTYTHEVVTLWYRAPEVLLGGRQYATPVDLWSVGCIMAELLKGEALFAGDSEIDTLFKMFRTLGTPTDCVWPGVSRLPDFKQTFPRWKSNPEEKLRSLLPQLDAAGLNLLTRLLTYDPAFRITASEALGHPWLSNVPRMASHLDLDSWRQE